MSWIAVGIAAAGVASGAAGGIQRNRAIKSSLGSAEYGGQVLLEQTEEAAALERRRIKNQASLIRSRLRVLVGESGFGAGGSFADLDRAASIDEQTNLAIADLNLYNRRRKIASDIRAGFLNIAAGQANVALSALNSGLQGYMMGQQINAANNSAPQAGPTSADFRIEPDNWYGASDTYRGGYYRGGDYGGSAIT